MNAETTALLGLWAIPGLGPLTLAQLRRRHFALEALLKHTPTDLAREPELSAASKQWALATGLSVEALAGLVAESCRRAAISLCFIGDAAYPPLLAQIPDPPGVLFYRGPAADAPARRRLAMVGTRRPDFHLPKAVQALAREVAQMGVGVVSGGAAGIDTLCHLGAASVPGAETWAFLGSALDELDPGPSALWRNLEATGATLFSELPPGVRAAKKTFPRRNRLISGAADAVLVVRAGAGSGTRHTVRAAQEQGRVLLAMPGDVGAPNAAYCNELLRSGGAKVCLSAADAVRATGASLEPSQRPASVAGPGALAIAASVSTNAQAAYAVLSRERADFDQLLAASGLSSGALTSALCELELAGLVNALPGRYFQRV